jgi:hypothetical protein
MAVEKGLYGSSQLNNNDPQLWNTPTQSVVRSSTVKMAKLGALNIIGSFTVELDMTGTGGTKNMYFFNTGLAGPATLTAANGVLINGGSSIAVPNGCVVVLSWDGTTLTTAT